MSNFFFFFFQQSVLSSLYRIGTYQELAKCMLCWQWILKKYLVAGIHLSHKIMVAPTLVKHSVLLRLVWSGLMDQSFHGTLLQLWKTKLECGMKVWHWSLCFCHCLLVSNSWFHLFPGPLWLTEQHGTSCCDYLLAVPSYQTWCLWVSGPSCRRHRNVV